jgi:hypothetical protein
MSIKDQASSVDPNFTSTCSGFGKASSIYRLQQLENKMLRAEKRKFNETRKQIEFLKDVPFPKKWIAGAC